MADDRMTRFDVELFEAAADEGRRNHRSTRQPLEHWTRLGRQISAHETAARRRIVAAKGGEIPLSELATEEPLPTWDWTSPLGSRPPPSLLGEPC